MIFNIIAIDLGHHKPSSYKTQNLINKMLLVFWLPHWPAVLLLSSAIPWHKNVEIRPTYNPYNGLYVSKWKEESHASHFKSKVRDNKASEERMMKAKTGQKLASYAKQTAKP